MRKIFREDWYEAGTAILAEAGSGRLTIDALCSRLKVTKGSFYHHFRNLDGYMAAFMQHWAEERSLEFIRLAERMRLTGGRSELLARLAEMLGSAAERGVRAWAASSPLVWMYLQQVDGIRLKYLENLLREEGCADASAKSTARLEYALMVGLRQICPELSRKELLELYELRA